MPVISDFQKPKDFGLYGCQGGSWEGAMYAMLYSFESFNARVESQYDGVLEGLSGVDMFSNGLDIEDFFADMPLIFDNLEK